jgi:ATP-dependent helicase Lhr and Lhr-like helicase
VSENVFYRLAPFLQAFIYGNEWAELRPIQLEACRVIFETDAHLLLASGTASGKTEAAFLPILTLLHEHPSASVGVLYVSPIKALINDQFLRLGDMLRDAEIPVWHWHGDVGQAHKQKLLKHPSGVLQITPESLESLLINRTHELPRVFGDLRFVVIDEVHVFMDSDRGRQLLCQLARLERLASVQPRRVGLSATLGDYGLAESWLASGSNRSVVTPTVSSGGRKIRLALEHFFIGESDTDNQPNEVTDGVTDNATDQEPVDQTAALERYVFDSTRDRKALVFVNNRRDAESIIISLRGIAEREGKPDIYHVHHGSISSALREAAEDALREDDRPSVTAATVTLELGIDLGQLERVVQIDAPFSVSSFLQRLGRSGRRDQASEMWFVAREVEPTAKTPLTELIPWNLLQCIAVMQLYLEERWIEPKRFRSLPYSLLYHQTMSTLASSGELSPIELVRRVLPLPPFREISQDDFKTLLLHLLEIDHLQRTEEGGLIIGLTGERTVRNFRFYAVFADNDEYTVRDESREVGSIGSPPASGERFGLAGRTWQVLEVDDKHRVVYAKRVKGRAPATWTGGGGEIHTRILERMRQVLIENTVYPYLQVNAQARLEQVRTLARNTTLDKSNIVSLGGDTFAVFPWVGTVAIRTLERLFRLHCAAELEAIQINVESPYYLTFKTRVGDASTILRAIRRALESDIAATELLGPEEAPTLEKYDPFIPSELRRRAFASDHLDLEGLKSSVSRWY